MRSFADQELIGGCHDEPSDISSNPPARRATPSEMEEEDDDTFRTPNHRQAPSRMMQDEKYLHALNMLAVQRNCEGVLLLKCGDKVEKAIGCFRQSLGCIPVEVAPVDHDDQSFLSSSSCHQSTNEDFHHPRNHQARVVRSLQQDISNYDHYPPPPTILSVQIYKPKSIDDFFYVCTKAFLIQPPKFPEHGKNKKQVQQFGSSEVPYYPPILRAIVMYNLALTLHVKGIKTKCRSLQQQSLALYETSYRLLHDTLLSLVPWNSNNHDHEDSEEYKNGHDTSNFRRRTTNHCHAEATSYVIGSLLMACCNNMGHLAYYLRDDFGRSSRTMSNLEYLLSWMSANTNERTKNTTGSAATAFSFELLDHLDIRGFQWNVRFMYPSTNAAAA